MLFNSIEFAVFFPVVFFLYWFVFQKNIKLQNIFLLIVSYIFYGWWDWRFLSLIIFSSSIDFFIGLQLKKQNSTSNRKLLLLCSLLVNLGFLGFFKYYNFFVESFVDAFTLMGKKLEITTLNIVLPVGISFYTFQTLSYSIDIFRKKLQPTKDIIHFFAFVSFFPQLVAGPIERASNLLPQFYKKRTINEELIKSGLFLMLWGFFKKLVIADNLAIFVNTVYNNPEIYSSTYHLYASYFFAFQIFCDFSGYSDIAIGAARLLGFNLMLNFRQPYFSKSVSDFWKRWHISLSSWFRDYLYIPLGGNRVKKRRWYYNLFIVFIVSGLWHGAAWTFVVWGALHGAYLIFSVILEKNKTKINRRLKLNKYTHFFKIINILITFHLVLVAWIFFRANSLSDAFYILKRLFIERSYDTIGVSVKNFSVFNLIVAFCSIFILEIYHFFERKQNVYDLLKNKKRFIRWSIYYFLVFAILILGNFNAEKFIYFQF